MKKLSKILMLILSLITAQAFASAVSRNKFVPIGAGSPDLKTNDNYFYSEVLKKCEGELPEGVKWNQLGSTNQTTWQNSIESISVILGQKRNQVGSQLLSYLESKTQTEEEEAPEVTAQNQVNELVKRQMMQNCYNQEQDSVQSATNGGITTSAIQRGSRTRMSLEDCKGRVQGADDVVEALYSQLPESIAPGQNFVNLEDQIEQINREHGSLGTEERQHLGAAFAELLVHCEAAKSVLTYSDFEDEDALSSESVESSSGAMMACVNNPNPQQCMMQNAGAKVSCKNNGVETQDFPQCKKITNWLSGFTIAKQGLQMTQQVRVLDNQMDMQADLLAKQRETGTVGTKDALEAQKEGVEQQANMANERAVFDGAKAAILAGMINDMPTRKKLRKACVGAFANAKTAISDYANNIGDTNAKSGFTAKLADEKLTADSVCNKLVTRTSVVMNQKARSKFKLAAFKAGTDAAANIAKGAILNDQADQIGDAINDIEEYTPPEFNPWANYEDAKASECIANPDAEGCIQAQEQYTDFYGGNLRLNGDRGINSEGVNVGDVGSTDGDNDSFAEGTSGRGLIPNSFGDILPEGSQSNEFEGPTVAAGTMKKSSGGGAGGGGGGKAGAVSAPGRAPNTGGGPGGRKSQVGKGVKVKFGGTGGGSLAFRSGRGLATAGKKRANGNPLSNLFGKKGKGKKGKTMNFGRGPASGIGSKKGSIFQMISNGYNSAQKKKLLKEYKLVE